jgi:hypothetical protein
MARHPAAQNRHSFIPSMDTTRGMKLTWSIGVVLLIASACGGAPHDLGGAEAEEYAVWSAAIDAEFGDTHPRFVVAPETDHFPVFRDLEADPRLSRELVEHYRARNDRRVRVLSERLRPRDVGVLPQLPQPMGSVMEWMSDGTLLLSRVGFDRGRTRALVTVMFTCGGMCGRGAMLVLERDATSRWRQTAMVSWIRS